MEFFEAFEAERDGKVYLFPSGYLEKVEYARSNVFDTQGRPYRHPYVFSDGKIDGVRFSDEEILRCKNKNPPIKPFEEFSDYVVRNV